MVFATVDFHANGLAALDPRTGALRWSTVDVKPPGASLWSAPSDLITLDLIPVVGGGQLFGSGRTAEEGVCAYDGASGQRRWAFNTGERLLAGPVFAGGTVYAGTEHGMVDAIDAASGQARWRRALATPTDVLVQITVPPVVSGGLTAFGARDGKSRWKHTFSGTGHNASSLLPVVNNGIAFCYDADTLFALDAATGNVRWQAGGLKGTYQFPVLTPGAAHLSSLEAVVSFDPATNRTQEVTRCLYSPPLTRRVGR